MWRAPFFFVSLALLSLVGPGFAAPRQHTVLLGKWRTVKIGREAADSRQVRIRQLIVDGRMREYTAGNPHDITDRLFVMRRAQRVNDSLPEESAQPPRWIWRLDGWISVDRQTGHITQLNLPAFDPELSQVNWYQDYAAYCGSADDGSKGYMVVFQLGKRKPLLKKEFTGATCPAPEWERIPSRVTFNVAGEKSSFVVRARGAGVQPDANNEEEGPQ